MFASFYLCTCTTCAGVPGGQKRTLDFLELKSQMVVGLLVDTGNQTWVLLRSAIVLSHASFFCFFCLFGFKIFIVRPCLTLQPG